MRTDIIFQRDTEGTTDRIWGFTHLESVFEHPKVIVFPNRKSAQGALLSAAFAPEMREWSACCMRKGATKLAAPCAIAYLLFPTFPSVCPVLR